MGRGIVDLISYHVAELKPTILEEATVRISDSCGGNFVLIARERSEELPRTSLSPKLSRMVQDFILKANSGFSSYKTKNCAFLYP